MPTSSTRSVDRALDLLSAVTEDGALSLSEAARRTDLPASTALRLLRSLEAAGLVTRDEESDFRPGPRLIQLGARAYSREPLIAVAREAMEAVVARTGESVYLSVRGLGETAVYIAIVEGTHAVRHANWVGRTVPLAGTAAGQAFRGEISAGQYTRRADSVEQDVTAFSAPVVVGGMIVGALSSLVPTYRCTDELGERCGEALVAATARIAHALGGGD